MRVRGDYGAQISAVKASTDADIPLLHPPNSAPPHHNPNIAHRKVNLLNGHGNEAAGLVRRLGSWSAHLR